MATRPNRRDFVKTLALGAGTALATSARSYARTVGANDRLGIGMIGLGQMARGHLENLLEEPDVDIEIGHRSTSTAILGNIAYRTGHQVAWDRETESIVGDAEASKLLDRAYRAPWKL